MKNPRIILALVLLMAAIADYLVFHSRFEGWLVVGAVTLIAINLVANIRRKGTIER